MRVRWPGGSGSRAACRDPAVEESLYLGGGEPRRTSQIVLTAEPGSNTVQWAIGRVPPAGTEVAEG